MEEKNPDFRFWKIIMIIIVPILFWMVISGYSGKNTDNKKEIEDLKLENASLKRERKDNYKTIDSLKDAIFNVKLDGYIEKDRYAKEINSINVKLKNIK